MDKGKKDTLKKRALAGTAAALASASLVVGGLFHSPADLLDDPIDSYMVSQPDVPDDDLTGGDGGEDDTAPEEKRRTLSARLRARITAFPIGVRAGVFLPLWVIGWAIMSIASAVWGGVLSPAVSAALRWVCAALVLLLVLCVGVKSLFPAVPLKRLINRRTVVTAVVGMLLVGALDIILGVVMPDKENVSRLVMLISSSCVLLASGISALFAQDGKDDTTAAPPPVDAELASRRLIEEIASSYK